MPGSVTVTGRVYALKGRLASCRKARSIIGLPDYSGLEAGVRGDLALDPRGGFPHEAQRRSRFERFRLRRRPGSARGGVLLPESQYQLPFVRPATRIV